MSANITRVEIAEEKQRIIKEDLVLLEAKAKRLMEEKSELILKLVATREALLSELDE